MALLGISEAAYVSFKISRWGQIRISANNLAQEVFESRDAAAKWMSKSNKSLGISAPIILCETEIGAKQVCRVLQALEWGGAA